MPRIPTFDAGDGVLHPSEAGSAAFREAGAIVARNAARAGALVQQAGTSISGGLESFGKQVGRLEKEAQDHTDAQAELEATKDATANDLAALDGIQGYGTSRRDSDGNPAPSSGAFSVGADDTLQNYQKVQAAELEKFQASGASSSAVQRFQQQQARRAANLQVKAHSEAIAVAGAEALGNIDKTVNTSAALVDRHPEMLDAELGRFDDTVAAAAGGIGKVEAKATLGPKAVEAKGALITSAIASYAKNGQLDQVDRILNDPKYDQFIGRHRDAIENKVTQITRARVTDQNAQDAAEAKFRTEQQDQLVDKIYRNQLLPPEQQDPSLSRTALETSQLFVGKPEELKKARATLDSLHQTTIDPDNSMRISQGISRGIMDGTITSPAQIDQAFSPTRPGQSITWQDRTRLQTELKDAKDNPAVKEFNANTKEWLQKNESYMDPNAFSGPSGRTALGQQMVSRWQAEVQRRAQIMRTNGEDPHDLLDPNSPKSMVTPQALAPYRVTQQMQQQYAKQQTALDKNIDQTRAGGQIPTGQVPVPKDLETVQGLLRNPQTGQFYDPNKKKFYNADGGESKMNLQGPSSTPNPNAPVTVPKGSTPDDIKKNYAPGTRFIIPDGPKAGHIGVVPGAQKMNFAPEDGGNTSPAQRAINDALQPRPDAHLDKNLFSSGRYAELGIKGGVGENLTPISVQGQNVQVNAQAAPHFKAFLEELTARGYKIDSIGGFNERMKRGSLSSYSEHAFGNAIDINPDRNAFHSRQTDMPADIGKIAARYGLIWGGDWNGRSVDPMHFEWSGKGGLTQFAGR